MIGGINVLAVKVNTIDKGYFNVGPLFLQDWNGYSKQNYGSGEINGDADFQFGFTTIVNDTDAVDQPIAHGSVV
ncbi:hypothetical protein [Tumebacillus flagellatus]|uniref:Uncharacterized protein n=1 Tax=Tumebacillus flagellatus TaxID=1157490 RepID=A0A074LTI7_9BACL|nr:hypothetical protein [Tumebacillus flagellatus]KEO83885.1 hypothetical protein EL26_08195 [Tumebacillus flagellatus]